MRRRRGGGMLFVLFVVIRGGAAMKSFFVPAPFFLRRPHRCLLVVLEKKGIAGAGVSGSVAAALCFEATFRSVELAELLRPRDQVVAEVAHRVAGGMKGKECVDRC